MIKSETTKELFTALAKAQSGFSAAKKDSQNPHFRSKYADLASCWEVVKEPLSKNGLSLTQWVTASERGVSVITLLGHSSGEFIQSEATFPVKDVSNPQSMGSSITYARRYCMSAALGLVADDDDDGNAAAKTSEPVSKPAFQPASKPIQRITKEQYQELLGLATTLGYSEETLIASAKGKGDVDSWDASVYVDLKSRLQKAIEQRLEKESK